MTISWQTFRTIALATLLLTFVVVVLGAYVRLSDAGLGCPDWPGCYGQSLAPLDHHDVSAIQAEYPDHQVHMGKAWKEMIHRYVAGSLGLLVFFLAWQSWRQRQQFPIKPWLPLGIGLVIVFQGLLGMWTVTMKLNPVVVMSHLLGGLTVLSLLWWLVLQCFQKAAALTIQVRSRWRPTTWLKFALAAVILQIALGGWTSANYAALACPDFPTCQTHWIPPTDFGHAFDLWQDPAATYEGGVLPNDARVTIHWSHRLGALVVLGLLFTALWQSWRSVKDNETRLLILLPGLLVISQIGLGISNVVLKLPLLVAVAHNGVAALLLLSLLMLYRHLSLAQTHTNSVS